MASIGSSIVAPFGTTYDVYNSINTIANSFVDVVDITIPASTTRTIYLAGVSCSMSGLWQLTVNGTARASGRTAPGKPDSFLNIPKGLVTSSADEVKLIFKARENSPIVSVDGFINAVDS